MNRTMLALALSAVFAAAACSSAGPGGGGDDDDEGQQDDDDGSSGPSLNGSSGSGGPNGSSGSGNTAGSGSPSGAGPSGAGPSGAGPSGAGPSGSGSTSGGQTSCDGSGDCSSCANCTAQGGACEPVFVACDQNQACWPLYDCLGACQDQACADQCNQQYSAGQQALNDVLSCIICQQCPSDCDAASQCG